MNNAASSLLVLSLFPGIGILDRGFEDEGFTVVRGPDLLWGGDVRRFSVPAETFTGVIGGPPCQCFSSLVRIIRSRGQQVADNLIPEFERLVSAARPGWFVMENVPGAPAPIVPGYQVVDSLLDTRWLGLEQSRRRRFFFGTPDGKKLHFELAALDHPIKERTVTSKYRKDAFNETAYRSLKETIRLTGLPDGFFDHSPFTLQGKMKMLGNAVPYPMARVVARSVKTAMGLL
jgi:DNA (cytosine-5)-methyltransferase 1